jgi:dihydrofolate reductase
MGKLTYGMNISVDGYTVDGKGEIPWVGPDDEVHQFWNDRVRDTAVSLYGRKLYELMSAYWPTADQDPDITPVAAEFARLWVAMPKVVFSKTLSSVDWNSHLERGDVVEVARKLKAETDGMLEVAGATLAAPLVRAGLVDEFVVVVTPVAVGGGTPFFPALEQWVKLELVENRTFPTTGSVLLRFVPVRD